MTTKHTTCDVIFSLAIAAAFLGGCAASSGVARQNQVEVERRPSQKVAIASPVVVANDNSVTVRGRVRRIATGSVPLAGHVDIDLLNAEGKVVQSASDAWFPALPPHRVGRSLPNTASYAVTFPTALSADGVVRITVGTDSHEK